MKHSVLNPLFHLEPLFGIAAGTGLNVDHKQDIICKKRLIIIGSDSLHKFRFILEQRTKQTNIARCIQSKYRV